MELELRDYQTECVKRVLASYEQDRHGTELIVMPTGGGKTIVFSELIARLGLVSLILAHRDELLDQAADKYHMIKPDAIIGKVGSGQHQYGGEVTMCSVQTLSRPEHLKRLKTLYGTGNNLFLITDEAHHSMAESYQRVYETLPDAFHLMVTATPDRLDGKPLLPDGKKPLYESSILDMIADGYLCDLKAVAIKTHLNLENVHTSMGDYKIDELEAAVDTPERNRRIVEGYKEHASGRRAACFAVTVEHAEHLAEAFNRAGVSAGVVVGSTPLDSRKKLYRAFRDESVKILATVNVLSEGWDEPLCDCIIMARPTQSRALFVQAIGRGLRLAPGKQNCVILDITDNCLKHRLEPQNLRKVLGKPLHDDETILEALKREEEEIGKKTETPVVRKLKETRDKDLSIDILTKLDWTLTENGLFVLEVGSEKHRIALVPDKEVEGAYSVWARLAPMYTAQRWLPPSPLDWAQSYAEKNARKLLADPKNTVLVNREAAWRSYPATEVQLEKLAKWQKKFNLQYDPLTVTRGEATEMLDKVYESPQFAAWKQWRQKQAV